MQTMKYQENEAPSLLWQPKERLDPGMDGTYSSVNTMSPEEAEKMRASAAPKASPSNHFTPPSVGAPRPEGMRFQKAATLSNLDSEPTLLTNQTSMETFAPSSSAFRPATNPSLPRKQFLRAQTSGLVGGDSRVDTNGNGPFHGFSKDEYVPSGSQQQHPQQGWRNPEGGLPPPGTRIQPPADMGARAATTMNLQQDGSDNAYNRPFVMTVADRFKRNVETRRATSQDLSGFGQINQQQQQQQQARKTFAPAGGMGGHRPGASYRPPPSDNGEPFVEAVKPENNQKMVEEYLEAQRKSNTQGGMYLADYEAASGPPTSSAVVNNQQEPSMPKQRFAESPPSVYSPLGQGHGRRGSYLTDQSENSGSRFGTMDQSYAGVSASYERPTDSDLLNNFPPTPTSQGGFPDTQSRLLDVVDQRRDLRAQIESRNMIIDDLRLQLEDAQQLKMEDVSGFKNRIEALETYIANSMEEKSNTGSEVDVRGPPSIHPDVESKGKPKPITTITIPPQPNQKINLPGDSQLEKPQVFQSSYPKMDNPAVYLPRLNGVFPLYKPPPMVYGAAWNHNVPRGVTMLPEQIKEYTASGRMSLGYFSREFNLYTDETGEEYYVDREKEYTRWQKCEQDNREVLARKVQDVLDAKVEPTIMDKFIRVMAGI